MKNQKDNLPATRPIDLYFKQYANAYPPGIGRTLQVTSAYIILLGLLGICWALPFPHLKWLGGYNDYINWASILMAVVGYYYYRLSPVLSYLILLVMFVFTYGISESQIWEKAGGPALGTGSALVLFLAFILWFISCKITVKQELVAGYVKMLFIAPAWLMHLLLKKLSSKY